MESQTIKTQTITTNTLKHSQSSFTLIELLVVIVIIGTLAGMIFVNVSGVIERAKIARSLQFSDSLRNALIMNLVSEWKFDENSGTTAKDSWGGNNGTLYSSTSVCSNPPTSDCPTWKTGGDCISGSCLQFDGSDDYVNLPVTPKYSQYTISVWINGARDQDVGGIIMTGGLSLQRWGLFLDSKKITSINSNGTTRDCWQIENYNFTNYPAGWHLITITDDGTTRKFYRDGTYVASHTNTITNEGPDANFRIGKGGFTDASFFNGLIDEVRIYNAALPTAQIQQHYAEGLKSLLANNATTEQEYAQRISDFNQILVKN